MLFVSIGILVGVNCAINFVYSLLPNDNQNPSNGLLSTSPVILGMQNSSINYYNDPNIHFHDIKNQAKDDYENSVRVSGNTDNLTVKGKPVVIDMTSSNIKEFYINHSTRWDELTDLANGKSVNLTVFCIIKQENNSAGQWDISGTTKEGYRLTSKIVVFYYPENEIIGAYIVEGSVPPTHATLDEISGVRTTNIDHWINSLPLAT